MKPFTYVRAVDADEALRLGMVSRVTEDGAVVHEARAIAETLCSYGKFGVESTKQVLWANLEAGSLEAAIDLENRNQLLVRLTTNNLEEAIRARREKRKPIFRD